MDLGNRSGWVVVKTTIMEENAESAARTNPVHCSGQQRLRQCQLIANVVHAIMENIQSTLFDDVMF